MSKPEVVFIQPPLMSWDKPLLREIKGWCRQMMLFNEMEANRTYWFGGKEIAKAEGYAAAFRMVLEKIDKEEQIRTRVNKSRREAALHTKADKPAGEKRKDGAE